jgi:hypothetical protein
VKKALLLAAAAAVYFVLALTTAPGFFDGIAPPEPYRWVSPPPELRSGNQPPLSGHGEAKLASNGQVDPGSAFTGDGQAQLSFVPGVFAPPASGSAVGLDLKPVSTFPPPAGITLSTNVYLITANAKLQKQALIALRYPDGRPAPTDIYTVPQGSTDWRSLGANQAAQPFVISAQTSTLGYFAAGYAANVSPPANAPRASGQTLPILIAAAILFVVLAGLPLAVLRRRGGNGDRGR